MEETPSQPEPVSVKRKKYQRRSPSRPLSPERLEALRARAAHMREIVKQNAAIRAAGGVVKKRRRRRTKASLRQASSAALLHGKRVRRSRGETPGRQLAKIDSALPKIVSAFVQAQAGNMAPLNLQVARDLAAKAVIRNDVAKKIKERGVEIEEPILDSTGKLVGTKIKANPLLEALRILDDQLGLTVEQARLSKRSKGEGDRDDAITDTLHWDERLRAANRLALPPADAELLREGAIDTEIVQ